MCVLICRYVRNQSMLNVVNRTLAFTRTSNPCLDPIHFSGFGPKRCKAMDSRSPSTLQQVVSQQLLNGQVSWRRRKGRLLLANMGPLVSAKVLEAVVGPMVAPRRDVTRNGCATEEREQSIRWCKWV